MFSGVTFARNSTGGQSERRLPRVFLGIVMTAALVLSLAPGLAQGKSVGGCPTGSGAAWTLVLVSSLGIDPETAMGIPSLDGNRDGWTCIRTPPQQSPLGELTIFRDNTV
jgi:hypothetical protein